MTGPVKWVVQVNSGAVRYANGTQPGDSSFQDSLKVLRDKRRALGLAKPVGVIAAMAVLAALALKWPLWIVGLMVVAGGAATWFAHEHDLARRTAVMQYELDRNVRDAYARLVTAAKAIAACNGLWQLVPATIGGGKERAGLSMHFSAPEFLVTNVDSFSIAWSGHTMHFFPDRVLVYEAANAHAISYRQLTAVCRTIQVAEENTPPDDAKVVGQKWRHANPDGTRDTNHPVNRELPLCEYGEIEFKATDGLHETLQCSRLGAAHEFAHALRTVASLVPDSA
ncbi:hypothetical protein [Ramlibacter albus]|uniref:DUF3137 domain-containing protein n=1 Tax=Ramlibacter albus TaxID=2079448 RepID=A0A923S526_9BURK|nr:hypothetical protein [Ramlibacter albus]MBC5768081.1 hypothetical protein [Ramlibacter albus]